MFLQSTAWSEASQPRRRVQKNISQFLHSLDVVQRRAPSTTKAYRAAIGHVTRSTSGYNPGQNWVCSLLIKSIERSKPPSYNLVLTWDVGKLHVLLQPEYDGAFLSCHLLTEKTTFLLAIEERRSGLHALAANVELENSSPTTLSLRFVDEFVPKAWFVRKNKVRFEPIVLPCVGNVTCKTICRVHTVIRYLNVVKSSRNHAQTSLLILHAPTNSNSLSLHAVPRYFIKLVHNGRTQFRREHFPRGGKGT